MSVDAKGPHHALAPLKGGAPRGGVAPLDSVFVSRSDSVKFLEKKEVARWFRPIPRIFPY